MCSTKKADEIVRVAEEGSRRFITKANKKITDNIRKADASGVDFEKIRRKLVDGNKNE